MVYCQLVRFIFICWLVLLDGSNQQFQWQIFISTWKENNFWQKSWPYTVFMEKIFFRKKIYLKKLQFIKSVLLTTEKVTYLCKQRGNILTPYFLNVLLSIPYIKLPWIILQVRQIFQIQINSFGQPNKLFIFNTIRWTIDKIIYTTMWSKFLFGFIIYAFWKAYK